MSAPAGKFEVAQPLESPRGLTELQKAGPPPSPPARVSDSVGLGWVLQICISSKFPRGTEAGGPVTTLD